jgi:1-acyl-sn-glycerol-3-phosphate acyltransferase
MKNSKNILYDSIDSLRARSLEQKTIPSDFIREVVHPLLRSLMMTKIPIEVALEKPFDIPKDSPTVFTPLHFCSYDVPIITNVIKKHFYFMGAIDTVEGMLSRAVVKADGIISIDRLDPDSRKKAQKKANEILRRGKNVAIFPEGTWNPSDELTLPFWAGAAKLARTSDSYVMPIATEYTWNTCYVYVGEAIKVNNYKNDVKATNAIREITSEMKSRLRDKYGLPPDERLKLRKHHREIYPYLNPLVEMQAVQGWKHNPEKIKKLYSSWLDDVDERLFNTL